MKHYKQHISGEEINYHTSRIKIRGYIGTWYVIDKAEHPITRKPIYLLEHEKYGDEVAGIIVDQKGTVLLDEAWNGFEDFEDHLISEE